MLKGHTLIELTDTETGEVKRIEKVNMLTNALDYILNDNLCGHHNFPTDHPELCFPIVNQLLGGILLFPESIDENAEIVFPPTIPTGYGGSSTDAGDDVCMGTYNPTESGEVTGGYKHVWDFATSQANGNISCVCLTHRLAGNGFMNNLHNLYYCEGFNSKSYDGTEDTRNDVNDKTTRLFACGQVVDYDGYRPITVGWDGEAIRVLRWDIVTSGTGINSERNDIPPYTKYEELASYTPQNVMYTQNGTNVYAFSNNFIFQKMSDGKYHGYSHYTNSAGNAEIFTVVFDPTDWSCVEGKFTLSGKQLYSLSERGGSNPNVDITGSSSYYFYYKMNCAIRGSYMYALSADKTKVYKINLNDTSRVTAIDIPFRLNSFFFLRINPVTNWIDVYTDGEQSDGKYRYGSILKDDSFAVGERTASYGYGSPGHSSSYFFVSNFGNTFFAENLLGIAGYKTAYDGVVDYSEKYAYLGYLASINNISTFVKTAAQTMKITYTITETEDVTLSSIVLTANPTKTTYVAGSALDLSGMQVTAVYSDGVRKDVTASVVSDPAEGTTLTDTDLDEITISYTEDGITRYATVPITVYELLSITVTSQPKKVAYYAGDALNLTGAQVMAYYSDGSEADITEKCTYTPANGAELTAGVSFVSVQYTEGLVSKVTTIPISVTAVVLESIVVTTMPKSVYEPGDKLDLSDMVVTATYNSGATKDVTNNVTTAPVNGATLSEGEQAVIVTYSENGVTKTATFTVYVTSAVTLSSIEVTTQPTKTEYNQNNTLDLTGIVVTATYTDGNTADVTSGCTFSPANGDTLASVGTQIVNVSYTEDNVTVSTSFNVTVAEAPTVEIVPWATGTDEQIAAMVAALDAGTLSVEDTGWAVGDERTVSLAAMAATGVGESHAEQDVVLVLGNAGGKYFEDGTECHFVVLQKDSLNESGYMNSSNTNSGGWEGCARRAWCNDVYSAAIPAALLPIFKRFKNVSGVGGGASSGTQETVDLFALAGEGEIFGSRTYAFADEVSAETQFEWYKTSANRVKKRNGSADSWWERSARSGSSINFCSVSSYGNANSGTASSTDGLAPFGCI